MEDKAHLTAISRNKPSLPMQWLAEQNLLKGSALDYGCGRGFDADYFNMAKYDPHFFPRVPAGRFDTITCNYVLNVVDQEEGERIVARILRLLEPGGCAYITVRRDRFTEGFTSKGTYQRWVELPYKSLRRTAGYEIYKLEKT